MPAKEQQSTEAPEAEQHTSSITNEMLDLTLVQSLGLAMQNAVTAQQNAQTLNSAIVSATVARILSAKTVHATGNTDAAATKENSTANRKK